MRSKTIVVWMRSPPPKPPLPEAAVLIVCRRYPSAACLLITFSSSPRWISTPRQRAHCPIVKWIPSWRRHASSVHPFSRCCGRADNQGMDAPRGSADFEESDELQRLRRRAYGPNADIAGDAAAQARLSELEAAERREHAPVVDAAAALRAPVSERVPVPEPFEGSRPASTSVPQPVNGASAEHEPDGGSVTGQDPAGVPIADSEPTDGARSAPWWRRRRLLPWVIAAVVVLAAAIGIGVFVVDESNRPTPVAQLTPQGQPGTCVHSCRR